MASVRILNAKQIDNNAAANPQIVLTGSNQPVSGRKLAIGIIGWWGLGYGNPAQYTHSVQDDKGSTWARLDDGTDAANPPNERAYIYVCDYAGSGDCTIQINQAATSGQFVASGVIEIDGLLPTGYNDTGARGNGRGNTSGVDAIATAAGATAQADNVVLSAMAVTHNSAASNVAVPAGWQPVFTETDGSANENGGFAYKIINATETPVAQWSYDDTAQRWQAVLVTLKAQAAAQVPSAGRRIFQLP